MAAAHSELRQSMLGALDELLADQPDVHWTVARLEAMTPAGDIWIYELTSDGDCERTDGDADETEVPP